MLAIVCIHALHFAVRSVEHALSLPMYDVLSTCMAFPACCGVCLSAFASMCCAVELAVERALTLPMDEDGYVVVLWQDSYASRLRNPYTMRLILAVARSQYARFATPHTHPHPLSLSPWR